MLNQPYSTIPAAELDAMATTIAQDRALCLACSKATHAPGVIAVLEHKQLGVVAALDGVMNSSMPIWVPYGSDAFGRWKAALDVRDAFPRGSIPLQGPYSVRLYAAEEGRSAAEDVALTYYGTKNAL